MISVATTRLAAQRQALVSVKRDLDRARGELAQADPNERGREAREAASASGGTSPAMVTDRVGRPGVAAPVVIAWGEMNPAHQRVAEALRA